MSVLTMQRKMIVRGYLLAVLFLCTMGIAQAQSVKMWGIGGMGFSSRGPDGGTLLAARFGAGARYGFVHAKILLLKNQEISLSSNTTVQYDARTMMAGISLPVRPNLFLQFSSGAGTLTYVDRGALLRDEIFTSYYEVRKGTVESTPFELALLYMPQEYFGIGLSALYLKNNVNNLSGITMDMQLGILRD